MADETTTTEPTEQTDQPDQAEVEKQAFLDRLDKESGKRKEAEKRTKDLEGQFADLQAQLQAREEEGLPELERERKRAETLEKKIADAEQRAEEADRRLKVTERQRWVTQAATKAGFIDPEDAVRYVDLDSVEDPERAEREIKRITKAKDYLVKRDDPQLPGRVLENGQPKTDTPPAKGRIDLNEEAETVASSLKEFLAKR